VADIRLPRDVLRPGGVVSALDEEPAGRYEEPLPALGFPPFGAVGNDSPVGHLEHQFRLLSFAFMY
jgi:hypothetical protein